MAKSADHFLLIRPSSLAIFIIQRAAEILRQEPNLLEVEAPITGV